MGSGTPARGPRPSVRGGTVTTDGIELGCPDAGDAPIKAPLGAIAGTYGSLAPNGSRVSIVIDGRSVGVLADTRDVRRLARCLQTGVEYTCLIERREGELLAVYERC